MEGKNAEFQVIFGPVWWNLAKKNSIISKVSDFLNLAIFWDADAPFLTKYQFDKDTWDKNIKTNSSDWNKSSGHIKFVLCLGLYALSGPDKFGLCFELN